MHFQVCSLENIESWEFHSALRKISRVLSLSNYFHQKISTVFKVKISYFRKKLRYMSNNHVLLFQRYCIFILYQCTRPCFVLTCQFTANFCFPFLLVYMMASYTTFNSKFSLLYFTGNLLYWKVNLIFYQYQLVVLQNANQ